MCGARCEPELDLVVAGRRRHRDHGRAASRAPRLHHRCAARRAPLDVDLAARAPRVRAASVDVSGMSSPYAPPQAGPPNAMLVVHAYRAFVSLMFVYYVALA